MLSSASQQTFEPAALDVRQEQQFLIYTEERKNDIKHILYNFEIYHKQEPHNKCESVSNKQAPCSFRTLNYKCKIREARSRPLQVRIRNKKKATLRQEGRFNGLLLLAPSHVLSCSLKCISVSSVWNALESLVECRCQAFAPARRVIEVLFAFISKYFSTVCTNRIYLTILQKLLYFVFAGFSSTFCHPILKSIDFCLAWRVHVYFFSAKIPQVINLIVQPNRARWLSLYTMRFNYSQFQPSLGYIIFYFEQ